MAKEAVTPRASLQTVPQSAWDSLAEKRIFFGHQSVGGNIIEGMKAVLRDNPNIRIRIEDLDAEAPPDAPAFLHSRIGANADIPSKVRAFETLLESGPADRLDIAFMKLCYLDIKTGTNVAEGFAAYQDMIRRMRVKHPATRFLHVTVPLTRLITGWKTWIKSTLRFDSIWEYDDNVARGQYNDMLKREFGQEPVFDLSLLESLRPDGTRATFVKNGITYCALAPEHTYDSGHLNESGRRMLAEQLLIALASNFAK